MGKGKSGRNKEKVKKYYDSGRAADNKIRKRIKHEERQEYFKKRNERFQEIIPEVVDKYITIAVKNEFTSSLANKGYAEIINNFADDLIAKNSHLRLPRGRVKAELRNHLKP